MRRTRPLLEVAALIVFALIASNARACERDRDDAPLVLNGTLSFDGFTGGVGQGAVDDSGYGGSWTMRQRGIGHGFGRSRAGGFAFAHAFAFARASAHAGSGHR